MKRDWECSCGCHNIGKFCVDCGKPRNKFDKTKETLVVEEWSCVCRTRNTTPYCTNCGRKESDFEHVKTTTVKSEIISFILLVVIMGLLIFSVKHNFFQTSASDTDIAYSLENMKETLYDIESLKDVSDAKDVAAMKERIEITRSTLRQRSSDYKNVFGEDELLVNSILLVVEKYDELAVETISYIENNKDHKSGEELVYLANEINVLIDRVSERKKGLWYRVGPIDYGKSLKAYGENKVRNLQKKITDVTMGRKDLGWITTESKIFDNKVYIYGYFINNSKKMVMKVRGLNLEIAAFNEYGEKIKVITRNDNIANGETIQPGNKLNKSIAVNLEEFDEDSDIKFFVVKQLE